MGLFSILAIPKVADSSSSASLQELASSASSERETLVFCEASASETRVFFFDRRNLVHRWKRTTKNKFTQSKRGHNLTRLEPLQILDLTL